MCLSSIHLFFYLLIVQNNLYSLKNSIIFAWIWVQNIKKYNRKDKKKKKRDESITIESHWHVTIWHTCLWEHFQEHPYQIQILRCNHVSKPKDARICEKIWTHQQTFNPVGPLPFQNGSFEHAQYHSMGWFTFFDSKGCAPSIPI